MAWDRIIRGYSHFNLSEPVVYSEYELFQYIMMFGFSHCRAIMCDKALPPDFLPSQEELTQLKRLFDLKARSIRNRTRGRLGEVAAELLMPLVKRDAVIRDRMTFTTPLGARRLDNFLPETREAIESKNTRAVANRRTRVQVLKDAYLLKEGLVSKVVWMLFFGASPRLIALLEAHDIQYVEGWDALLAAGRANVALVAPDGAPG